MPAGGPDPDTWRQRRTSFGSVAAGYAAHRPDYPADAVAFLVGASPRRVLDLGAGTGLLTGVLLTAGHEVVAVDPAGEMLAELRARYPQVTAHVGDAEAVPLPDGSVDAVVAGQAAHWFDPEPAAAQLRRVLRPGGVVGLVWNTRDEEVPWVAALGRVLADEARGHEADRGVVDAFARALGAQVEHHRSGIVQRLSPSRSSPASPRAATSPRWTTHGGRRSWARCARCSTPTPTPAAATSSTCRTGPTPTG